MNTKPALAVLILAASASVHVSEAAGARAADAPVAAPSASPSASASPSPSPSPGAGGRAQNMRQRRMASPEVAAVPAENHTQVRVTSVDVQRGTLTFMDVEGETNTWAFEPAALAHDPALKPDAKVTIVWKSDPTGQPIPKILGVVALAPPADGAGSGADAANARPRRPRPNASPSASPSPAS
jgi:hypothetical protein